MTTGVGLKVEGLRAGYGAREIVHGIRIEVAPGSVSLLLGANGAGKSTTLGSIVGRVERSAGVVTFGDQELAGADVHSVVSVGVQLVPEGGRVFRDLSVVDNLRLGAYSRGTALTPADFEAVYEIFPRLEDRKEQLGGTLSGGERQMLAVGRALMARPRLLLLDEPFLGLAPVAINDLVTALRRINSQMGISMLIVEQNIKALEMADHAYVLTLGEISADESNPRRLMADGSDEIRKSFLGG